MVMLWHFDCVVVGVVAFVALPKVLFLLVICTSNAIRAHFSRCYSKFRNRYYFSVQFLPDC